MSKRPTTPGGQKGDIFSAFDTFIFGSFRIKVNIIKQYNYFVPRGIPLTLKQNDDLE